MTRRLLHSVVLLLVLVGATLPVQPIRAIDISIAPTEVTFPKDDGAHEALTEWWYYTGHIVTESGGEYGFQDVFFKAKRGFASGFAAHMAITDKTNGTFAYDQRVALPKGVAQPTSEGFSYRIGDWSMAGADGADHIEGSAGAFSWSLDLVSTKPAVLHGGDGYTSNESDAESYYYSRTRMSVTGTLTVNGIGEAVTGQGWMDHQWGDFENFSEGGWDWFSVQLDDNREVMVYYIRDGTDVLSLAVGTVVNADGTYTEIDGADVELTVTDEWTSAESGATYPMGWNLAIPSIGLEMSVVPVIQNQELDTRRTTLLTYWEGAVEVTGKDPDGVVTGVGYVELTGYARERDGRVP